MNYDIELSRIALKNMAKIPKKDLNRIQIRLEALSTEPMPEDMKKIRGDDNCIEFEVETIEFSIGYLKANFVF